MLRSVELANIELSMGKSAEKSYTVDGKVAHYSKEEDVNKKLADILGEKFTNYRKLWDSANRFETVTEFPLFLHFDMHQRCNYRCPQCIIAYPEELKKYAKGEEMDFETYKMAINEGASYSCPSLSVQGDNEPLLNPNLENYISYAHNKGFIDIMFNTNGSLLFKERAKRLLDSGLTRLRFSLDAYKPETYKEIRVGGNYDKVLENIDYFLDLKRAGGYKLPLVGVNFVLQKKNYKEVNDFIKFWTSKVDMVSIQNFLPPLPDKDFSDFYPPKESYPSSNISHSDGFKCVQPFQRLVIKNRDITPCGVMYSQLLSLGKFPETSLFDAWNSPKMKTLQQIHSQGHYSKNSVCQKCVASMF